MNTPLFTQEEILSVQEALDGFMACKWYIFYELNKDESFEDFYKRLYDVEEVWEDDEDNSLTKKEFDAMMLLYTRLVDTNQDKDELSSDCESIPSWAKWCYSASIDGEVYTVFLPFPINLSSDY